MHNQPILDARVTQAEIPAVYSRLAPVYDFWSEMTEARARRRCLELAAVRDGEDVLEVAVGTGSLFVDLVRSNPHGRTEGVDLTAAMLDRARTKVANLPGRHSLRVGDASALPFDDASFDLVANNYMFDLMPETQFATVLREFRRVLRPGGRLVVVNMAHADAMLLRVYELVYRLAPRMMGGCRGVNMAEHIRKAGFTGVTVERVAQLGFPSEVVSGRAD